MSFGVDADRDAGETHSTVVAPAILVWPALIVALLATVGSLWLSIRMELKACPLCFYQRTFAMSVLGILAIGMLAGARHRNVLNVLALPCVAGGFGVAAFHVFLEITGKLECPLGVMGIGTAPQQSLAVFAILLALVAFGAIRAASFGGPGMMVALAALALGGLLAAGAVASVPPMPATPAQPYQGAPEICRPPYRVTS